MISESLTRRDEEMEKLRSQLAQSQRNASSAKTDRIQSFLIAIVVLCVVAALTGLTWRSIENGRVLEESGNETISTVLTKCLDEGHSPLECDIAFEEQLP